MNKTELTKALANRSNVSQDTAKQLLNDLIEIIGETAQKGDDVELVGFGSFKVTVKPARVGRNPATGEPMNIAEKKVISFKPGKNLKDLVAGSN